MKNFQVLCLFVAVFGFFLSCSRSKQDVEISRVIVPLKNTVIVKDLQPYISELELIPLGSDSTSISGIRKVLTTPDSYFLLAGGVTYSMSKTGDNIVRIGRIGRGPGEYIMVKDIAINLDGTEYWCLDVQNTLLRYDIDSGSYIGSIELGKDYGQSEAIIPLSNGLFAIFFPNPYSRDISKEDVSFNCLKTFDLNGRLYNESLPWSDFNVSAAFSVPVSCSGSNISVLSPESNTPSIVFVNGKVEEKILIDFDRKNVPYRYAFRNGSDPWQMVGELFERDFFKLVSYFFFLSEEVYFSAWGEQSTLWNFFIPDSGVHGIRWQSIGITVPPVSAVGTEGDFIFFPFEDYGEIGISDEMDPVKRIVLKEFGTPKKSTPCLIKMRLNVKQ